MTKPIVEPELPERYRFQVVPVGNGYKPFDVKVLLQWRGLFGIWWTVRSQLAYAPGNSPYGRAGGIEDAMQILANAARTWKEL